MNDFLTWLSILLPLLALIVLLRAIWIGRNILSRNILSGTGEGKMGDDISSDPPTGT